jgi:hypothetical protein
MSIGQKIDSFLDRVTCFIFHHDWDYPDSVAVCLRCGKKRNKKRKSKKYSV